MRVQDLSKEQRVELLGKFDLFHGFTPDELLAVADEVQPVSAVSGDFLFHQGDQADALYLLVYGRLSVRVRDENDRELLVGEIAPGEAVGEMALFSGEGRSASVQVVRDSELLSVPREAFDRLVTSQPHAMLQLGRLIVQRYRRNLAGGIHRPTVKNIAVYQATRDIDLSSFTDALHRTLGALGASEIIRPEALGFDPAQPGCFLQRIHDLEQECRFMIFPCHHEIDAWTRYALAQADRILVLCSSKADASESGDRSLPLQRTVARREVVILHPRHETSLGSAQWCSAFATRDRHHVVLSDTNTMERLARLITGRAIGLVLSGGAARGLAHIGLIRALEDHGVPIDHVGGTSIGGIIAAQYAHGKSGAELAELTPRLWARGRTNDYTLPLYSFISGRRFAKLIRGYFGDVEMEDLWLNCFCVSANVTRACEMVHRSGLARHAVRATGAVPGLLPPVHLNGDVLVDGGVLNNIPTDVMQSLDRGLIIASRVMPRAGFGATLGPDEMVSGLDILWRRFMPGVKPRRLPSIGEVLVRSSFLSTVVSQHRKCELADFVIDFDLENYSMLGWKQCEKIIAESRATASPVVEGWVREHGSLLQNRSGLSE
jgi:NTE family protein